MEISAAAAGYEHWGTGEIMSGHGTMLARCLRFSELITREDGSATNWIYEVGLWPLHFLHAKIAPESRGPMNWLHSCDYQVVFLWITLQFVVRAPEFPATPKNSIVMRHSPATWNISGP